MLSQARAKTGGQGQDKRIAQIEGALRGVGYSGDMLVRGYQFLTGGAHVASADLVAFADPRQHDIATCCIVAQIVPESASPAGILQQLSYLAAPLAFVAKPDSVEVWSLRSHHQPPQPLGETAYGDLARYVSTNRLNAERLLLAKRGERQLTFLNVDPTLLGFAQAATTSILVKEFTRAVAAGQDELRDIRQNSDLSSEDLRALTTLAIRVLAARILEDKEQLQGTPAPLGIEVLKKAHSRFRGYFGGGTVEPSDLVPVTEAIWNELAGGAVFRSLTNEMLGQFYGRVLVTPEFRAQLRIHYTPVGVARQILQRLPIEDLPPESRAALDGTCGSGSFLLAAHERLMGLLPASMSPKERHLWLVAHLAGIDLDDFAVEVAKLSLLLFSLPYGDSWKVSRGDFLQVSQADLPDRSPGILVGNPPWGEKRKPGHGGEYHQIAADYLARYLALLPQGGLLGVVLPESFLDSRSCESIRKQVLDECDILEIWQLPTGIFEFQSMESSVLLARKPADTARADLTPAVRVRRVLNRKEDEKRFLLEGRETYAYVGPDATTYRARRHAEMTTLPHCGMWQRLSGLGTFDDVAAVFSAIHTGPGRSNSFSHRKQGPAWEPCIKGASRIEPYAIRDQDSSERYVDYSSDLARPRRDKEDLLRLPKVIINAKRGAGNPWRLYAAIDESGRLPIGDLNCVVPRDATRARGQLKELAGVLNSQIANAWIDGMNRTRNIGLPSLRRLPYAQFVAGHRRRLRSLVGKISALKASPGFAHSEPKMAQARDLTHEIDDLVMDAYALTRSDRAALRRMFAGFPRPGPEWQGQDAEVGYPEPQEPRRDEWRVVGAVRKLDTKRERVCVWIRDFGADDKPFWVEAWPDMPGWALREGAAFEAVSWTDPGAVASSADLSLTGFKPLEYGYLSADELIEHLSPSERREGSR